MRILSLIAGAATAALVGGLPAGAAEVHSLYGAGSWQVVTGTGDDQRQFCEIASGGAGGRQVVVLSLAGDPTLNLQMVKSSWAIPQGTPIDVVVTIDGTAWPIHTSGAGHLVGVGIPPENQAAFEQAFRAGRSMTVSFPGGSEPPWTGSLTSSNAVYNAFVNCRNTLLAAAPAPASGTGPFGAPAATQPFQAPPAQAVPPAPAAPTPSAPIVSPAPATTPPQALPPIPSAPAG